MDLQTGLIVQTGNVGKRQWHRDFRLVHQADMMEFTVSDRQWADKTEPIRADDPAELVMIRHSTLWRPGQPVGELASRILNVRTGECRRVPYRGATCEPLCFSQDRKQLYVGGLLPEGIAMGLFEINLENLKHRRLGLPLLNRGFVMFGALSPDGKMLAVSGPSERRSLTPSTQDHCRRFAGPPSRSNRSMRPARRSKWPDLGGFAASLTAIRVHAKIRGVAYDRNSHQYHAIHWCSAADLDKLQPPMFAAVKWYSLQVIAEISRLAPPPV